MAWTDDVVYNEEVRNEYIVVVAKPGGKLPLEYL